METLGHAHLAFKDIKNLFKEVQNQPDLENEDCLKALIKSYTGESVFREIG